MSEEQLDELAQHIRNLWVVEMRNYYLRTKGVATDWGDRRITKWDGGLDSEGKLHRSVWQKIADLVVKHDLEPETLVRALFYRKVNHPPTPNQGVGDYALAAYRNYTAPATLLEMKNELIHSFESQKQRALADVFAKKEYYKLDDAQAWRITISSNRSALTPLFRYCVAKNQGWDDIAGEFHYQAVRQYRRAPALYNDVWGGWIPDGFKQAALAKKGWEYEIRTATKT